MKTYGFALLAAATSLVAAPAPGEPAFKKRTIDLPALQLSGSSATAPQTISSSAAAASSGQPAYFPAAPTDLFAPASTRWKIIHDFQAREQPAQTDRIAPARGRKEPAYYPMSPLDLIGRKSDREKIIQEVRARIDREENRTSR